MGRHLLEMGLKPGPKMGEITRAVYEMQLDGRVTSIEEAKEAARKDVIRRLRRLRRFIRIKSTSGRSNG